MWFNFELTDDTKFQLNAGEHLYGKTYADRHIDRRRSHTTCPCGACSDLPQKSAKFLEDTLAECI